MINVVVVVVFGGGGGVVIEGIGEMVLGMLVIVWYALSGGF